MKSSIYILSVGLLVFLTCGCNRDDRPAPLNFKGYEGNPILTPGEPGSWDDLYVFCCWAIEYNDTTFLFYAGSRSTGGCSLGLATSADGYNFAKYPGNPILTGDQKGYDAFSVGPTGILKEDSLWVLYFNAREIAGYGSGPSFGRATAKSLRGPWTKSEEPILTAGRRGEWDSDFISTPVLVKDKGSYRMYYTAGADLVSFTNIYFGMATSEDGIRWKKHNDPLTQQHPFADSDPVMFTGEPGEWDPDVIMAGQVLPISTGFEMYYYGSVRRDVNKNRWEAGAIGYATSVDGIHWKKYKQNPVYSLEDDPHYFNMVKKEAIIHDPRIMVKDSVYLMYYDYGAGVNSAIGLALARVK